MTEPEARALLRRWPGLGGLEAWIAEQEWQEAPGGWSVTGMLQGWCFRIGIVPGGLHLTGGEPGAGQPAVWTVTG
jgi:hypothetical protein